LPEVGRIIVDYLVFKGDRQLPQKKQVSPEDPLEVRLNGTELDGLQS
jgi:hypothetical protein